MAGLSEMNNFGIKAQADGWLSTGPFLCGGFYDFDGGERKWFVRRSPNPQKGGLKLAENGRSRNVTQHYHFRISAFPHFRDIANPTFRQRTHTRVSLRAASERSSGTKGAQHQSCQLKSFAFGPTTILRDCRLDPRKSLR